MTDTIVRATAYDGALRAFAVTSKNTIEKAIKLHELNPLAAIALGRALSGAAMLSIMGKGDDSRVTLQLKGEGPMGGLIAVANTSGILKGYVFNNNYEDYGDVSGVGEAIGKGYLNIIKDIGLKQPYIGTVPLYTGEIGDDLAYYFTYSEQIPTLVALGVKINPDRSVKSAGGIIIQAMPGADESIIEQTERRLSGMKSVSWLAEEKKDPVSMLHFLIDKEKLSVLQENNISYNCDCSYEKMMSNLYALGKDELKKITDEQEEVETVCHFCNSKYLYNSDDIKKLANKIK